MSFLKDPHLDLLASHIETERLLIVPFSTDGRVDILELQEEFCKANKNFFVSPFLPTYEQELEFVKTQIEAMKRGEVFENFILDRESGKLLGAIGLVTPEEHRMNIGLWIREDEQGQGYATEAYRALLGWAKENTKYRFLKHAFLPQNLASRKLGEKFGAILQNETGSRGNIVYHIPLYP